MSYIYTHSIMIYIINLGTTLGYLGERNMLKCPKNCRASVCDSGENVLNVDICRTGNFRKWFYLK